MKFLCTMEFFHSGHRLYTAGTVYDITEKTAGELIAVDTKIPLGALSFFTPVDEEAVRFVKEKGGKNTQPAGGDATAQPQQPGRKELIAEAKNLGIKSADFMKAEDLKQAIEAAKKTQQPDKTTPPAGGDGTAATPQV